MKDFSLPKVLFLFSPWLLSSQAASRPNIVIFLADDMGIGDVGCYGNTTLQTPYIDSLARDGMKFTQHLAAETICTPSRSAFLTGRYSKRTGMDGGVFRALTIVASPTGLPTSEVTFADLAKDAGYKTALIGKWHLGLYDFQGNPVHHPRSRGFDYYYGLPLSMIVDLGDEGQLTIELVLPNITRKLITVLSASICTLILLFSMNLIRLRTCVFLLILLAFVFLYMYINLYCLTWSAGVLMKDFETVEMPIRLVGLTERFAREGAEFIRNQSDSGNPFLLFMSWGHTHTFLAPSRQFAGRTIHGRYGDSVEELDWGTGIILEALDDVGAHNNTLVYFTSDHGGSFFDFGAKGEVDGGYNGIYRGGKAVGGVDGGYRVPGLFRWPNVIKAGSVSDAVTTHLDIFPLISTLTSRPVPGDREIDGKDILPLLQDKTVDSPHDFFFHYCDGEVHAVRYIPKGEKSVWKLLYRYPNIQLNSTFTLNATNCQTYFHLDPPYLFDMTSDPGENQPINIDSDPKYSEIVSVINKAKEEHINSIPNVRSRLALEKILWHPHLQPCCNFPFCSCKEEKYKDEDIQ